MLSTASQDQPCPRCFCKFTVRDIRRAFRCLLQAADTKGRCSLLPGNLVLLSYSSIHFLFFIWPKVEKRRHVIEHGEKQRWLYNFMFPCGTTMHFLVCSLNQIFSYFQPQCNAKRNRRSHFRTITRDHPPRKQCNRSFETGRSSIREFFARRNRAVSAEITGCALFACFGGILARAGRSRARGGDDHSRRRLCIREP